MMLSTIWFENIKAVISQISDEESQRAAWCEGRNNGFPAVAEIYCQFFDDSDVLGFLGNEQVQGECKIVNAQLNTLEELVNLMKQAGASFDENPEDECIFFLGRDWQAVIGTAKSLINQLEQ